MRLVDRLVRRLVARGLFGHSPLVLHLTGRRTGRRLDVPVNHHALGGATVVLTNSPWRHDLAGGRTVDVTLRGVRRPATARLVDEPGRVDDKQCDALVAFGAFSYGATLHSGEGGAEEDDLLPDLTVNNRKECGSALHAFHAIAEAVFPPEA